jgi:TRAP-type C4-dicarboxylate transport system permease small subunit
MQRLIDRLALASAAAGGLVLLALVLMTCASIAGRALIDFGLGPVTGDFELVEAGIAFAVFAFLPLCQLRAGHATVDVFTSGLSDGFNRVLLAIWEILAALALALIAWRLGAGLAQKIGNGETTFLLQFPVWWAYAACLVPAVVAVIVAIWSAADRVRAAVTGRDTRPISAEASH